MKTSTFEAVRGMRDILPEQTPAWAAIEATFRRLLEGYGYREMRIPLLEHTPLFQRSIGEVTDIVEKEMYTFTDRSGDSLTLRPEATAGFVRAAIQHGLLHNQQQRLWCIGPMFRYERPQKGRYRQFHQLDVEAFGLPGPDVDAELILLLARAWRELGLSGVSLHINSLGSAASRAEHRALLVDYFQRHIEVLDDDSRSRLQRSPLRILDSKNPALTELIAAAPRLLDVLDDDSKRHFDELQALLDAGGVPFSVNPQLVRGLDYYNKTVFEWVASDGLGAQNTVCGGGRYDGLVGHMGGRDTPGIGFGLGLERLVMMLSEANAAPDQRTPHAYLVHAGDGAERRALVLAERLRDQLPQLRLLTNCGGGSFKSQFKRADRSGAGLALVIGESELIDDSVGFKALRGDGDDKQQNLNEASLIDALRHYLDAVKN